MASPNVLSALAGGIEGGINGYLTAQDLQDRAMQRKIAADSILARQQYQQQLEQDRQDRIAQQAQDATQREKDRQDAAALAKKTAQRTFITSLPDGPVKRHLLSQMGNDLGLSVPDDAFDQNNVPLPSYLQTARPEVQQAWQASGGKLTLTPDDFLSQDALDARKAKQKKADDDAAFSLFQREHNYDQSLATTKAQKDDPSLPAGVKLYLASLPAKYQGDYTQANAEFQSALPDMQRQHPHLDVQKARQAFNASFSPDALPARPTAADAAITAALGGRGGTPNGGGSILPQPRPAPSAPPVAAPAPTAGGPAPDPYLGLRQQIATATDPKQKLLLQDQLKRGIYGDLKNAGHSVSWSKAGELTVDGLPYHIYDAAGNQITGQPAAPAAAVAPARGPVGGPARPAAGGNTAQLMTQAQTLLQQLRMEADPAKQTAIKQQLGALRQQLAAARGGQ